MNAGETLKLSQNIHDWTEKYSHELGKELTHWKQKHAIGTPANLANSFDTLEEENRLLQVGVVGRVKAGKSSLLNALVFDGKNVLPKAATPMTAALTTLTYADAFSAQVQFYTQEDLNNIRANATQYELRLKEERDRAVEQLRSRRQRSGQVTEDQQFWEHVEKTALRATQSDQTLAAAHDQWQRICRTNIDPIDLQSIGQIKAENAQSLADQLIEFVGSDGHYMPLTKSVDIYLPLDSLRDIRIIDTPGINDPVQSREERTSKLLKDCDVVFIVSPAGQFLSEQDLDLMSRITQKEGVQELVLIASQVDNQLYGRDVKRATLQASLEVITNTLSLHMVETLKRLKSQYVEIGNTFDSLIQGGTGKVLHTSGICHSLSTRFDQQQNWDSGEHKAWENLQSNYQDFFTSDNPERCRANLNLLANTSALLTILERVRERKDFIIGQRRVELIKTKANALEAFRSDLLAHTKQCYQRIKSADIEQLKSQKKQLDNKKILAEHDLDIMHEGLVQGFHDKLDSVLTSVLTKTYRETKDQFEGATEEIQRTRTREKSGVGSWFARKLWGGGSETYTYTVFKLYLAPFKQGFDEFVDGLSSNLKNHARKQRIEFQEQLQRDVTAITRRHLNDEIDVSLIIHSTRGLISNIQLPELDLDTSVLNNLTMTGTVLSGNEARMFLDDARDALKRLEGQAKKQIRDFVEDTCERQMHSSIGKELFQDMQERIDQLEKDVNNRVLMLDRLQRMLKELEAC